MNCCNDFGQCKQGHGCPVRCTPVYQDPLKLSPSEKKAIVFCGIIFFLLVCIGTLSAIYML